VRTYLSVVLPLLALAIAVPLLGACHTTAGVGEDMSAAGHAVSSEAKKLTP
jgi:predicted small secreted protein